MFKNNIQNRPDITFKLIDRQSLNVKYLSFLVLKKMIGVKGILCVLIGGKSSSSRIIIMYT